MVLSGLTSLHSLHLGSPLHPAVLDILSVQFPALRKLTFRLEFNNPRGSEFWDRFKPLDTRLSHPDFFFVEEIRIIYQGMISFESILEQVGDAMPQIVERELLTVEAIIFSVRRVPDHDIFLL